MARPNPDHIVVIGAGAADLMAARELGRAVREVTLLEARDRCGGRNHSLPAAQVRYPGGGGRPIRPWRGSGHARLVARGGAFAAADSGYAMDGGGREVLAGGISRS